MGTQEIISLSKGKDIFWVKLDWWMFIIDGEIFRCPTLEDIYSQLSKLKLK